MKKGLLVSMWIAGALVYMWLMTYCFALVSKDNDVLMIGGIIGLLVLLATAIAVAITVVKKITKIVKTIN